ncbi:MAG: alpha/beta hydrolase [Spirochaetales bacterium]|nr:alpha/beta hydrolase [Spirochaetales bacterium]
MKRIAILLLLCVLLVSCSTTDYQGKTTNVLPFDISREDFEIIPEDDYYDQMKYMVEPCLDSIKSAGTLSALRDGHRIYYEYFDVPEEKGSVVILHGFTEFIRKYSEIIYYFTRAGYDVYMIEHYGHGYSERSESVDGNLSKVAVDDFEVYTNDVKQFVDEVVLPLSGDNPLVLFGHSMGGGIATRFLEIYPDVFDYAILSSPMIGINLGAVPEWAAKFLSGSANVLGQGAGYVFGHYDWDAIEAFSDPGCPATSYPRYYYFFEMRTENEYHQTYGATWSWLNSALKATEKMVRKEEAEKVTIPVLLFQAETDSLVRNDRQNEFASKAANVHVVKCPDSHHEIFNSPDAVANAYWVTVFDFLDGLI